MAKCHDNNNFKDPVACDAKDKRANIVIFRYVCTQLTPKLLLGTL